MEELTGEQGLEKANKFKGINLKRMAAALERIAKTQEQLNWNIGFAVEIKKRQDPKLAKEIAEEWDKRKKEKGKST